MTKRTVDVNKELFDLIETGSVEDFEESIRRYPLVKNGKADLQNCVSKRGCKLQHILNFAICKEKVEQVNLLLDMAEIDLESVPEPYSHYLHGYGECNTPLYHACDTGNFEIITALVEKNENLVRIEETCLIYECNIHIFASIKHDDMVIFLYLYEKCRPITHLSKMLTIAVENLSISVISFILLEIKKNGLFSSIDSYNILYELGCSWCFTESGQKTLELKKKTIFKILYNFLYPENQYGNNYDFRKIFPFIKGFLEDREGDWGGNDLTMDLIIENTYLNEKNSKRGLIREILDYDPNCWVWVVLLHDEMTLSDFTDILGDLNDGIRRHFWEEKFLLPEQFLRFIEEVIHFQKPDLYEYRVFWSDIYHNLPDPELIKTMNFEKCIQKMIQEEVSFDWFILNFWIMNLDIDDDIDDDIYGQENEVYKMLRWSKECVFIRPFLFKLTPNFMDLIKRHDNYFKKILKQEVMLPFWPFNEIKDIDLKQRRFKDLTLQDLARDAIREEVWQKTKTDATIINKEIGFRENLETINFANLLNYTQI